MSPSTAKIDKTVKKDLYEQTFHTSDYFVYDPFDPNSLQGWHLDHNQQYQSLIPDERGWLWCQKLGLWLGTYEGIIDRETAIWLRFYDVAGNLVLLPDEAAAAQAQVAVTQAEIAVAQAQAAVAEAEAAAVREEAAVAQVARLAARLRELGENPEIL